MEIHATISYLMVTKIVKGPSCATFNYTSGLASKNQVNTRWILGSKLVGSVSN